MWQSGVDFFARVKRRAKDIVASGAQREYSAALPEGFGASRISLRLSLPGHAGRRLLSFCDHVVDADGRATDTVVAATWGGLALSHDLGRSWRQVRVKGYEKQSFIRAKWLGRSEILAQASTTKGKSANKALADLLVVTDTGEVVSSHPSLGHRWHGCRAIDFCGDTLMYAEYPRNEMVNGRRLSSGRVFRSRDRGRSWQVVFEKSGGEIRHFHFLQGRPGHSGEWWLTSGDYPHECHIWVTRDDGDSWNDLTSGFRDGFEVDGTHYERDAFRLTDLVWQGDDAIWATDDALNSSSPPGARVFSSPAGGAMMPRLVGRGRRHFRNIVDIGAHYLLFSQRSQEPHVSGPGVYLLCKETRAFCHLFDLQSVWRESHAGFTCSTASRAAKDGIFFTYRSKDDVFDGGHRMIAWKVALS